MFSLRICLQSELRCVGFIQPSGLRPWSHLQLHRHERHRVIVERARSGARVDVAEMAEELAVAPETVRRDLNALERQGLVRRVHGGAIAIERLGFEPSVDARTEHRSAEKERIGRAALDLLPERGTLLIDAGTTTRRLAESLPTGREFTVVTNSVAIATVVAARGDLTLHMLGGVVRTRTLAAVGPWSVDALGGIVVDVAFLGTNGLSIGRGLTTPDQVEAATKRAMVACAGRAVVLADHTKIGNDHFARFATIEQIDVLVCDTGLDDETAQEIELAGPEVIRA